MYKQFKQDMKKLGRSSHSSSQQQVRQVVTPQRSSISLKQKNIIEREITKLQTELDINQFTPQSSNPYPLFVSSSHLSNSRRTLQQMERKLHQNSQEHEIPPKQCMQTQSPVERVRAGKEVMQNKITLTAGSQSQKRLLPGNGQHASSSIDGKRQSVNNKHEISQSVIQSAFIPKRSQINYTASIQHYYSNKAQRKSSVKDISTEDRLERFIEVDDMSGGDSQQIVNLSTQAYNNNQKPQASNLHSGIQHLQNNLKQLEVKYHDLAKLYSKKQKPSQSPKKRLQKKKITSSTYQTDTPKRHTQKLLKQSGQSQSILQIQSAYADEVENNTIINNTDPHAVAVGGIEDPLLREFEQIMLFYKHQLDLKNSQRLNVYRMLKEDLHRLICTTKPQLSNQNQQHLTLQHNPTNTHSSSLSLDLEYKIASQKEAIFTSTHLNEQIQLEQKRALHLLQQLDCTQVDRIADIAQCLQTSKDRLVYQTKHMASFEKFNANLTNTLSALVTRADQFTVNGSNVDLEQQIHKLNAILAEQKEMHGRQMQELESQQVDLQITNKELLSQVQVQSKEITEKDQILNKRETQKQDLIQKLHSLTTREQKATAGPGDERWRHQLETLVHLTTRFLNSMRRLQKLVHKREPNVTAEKQDFENAKKDLEITLKTAFSSLQLVQGGRQGGSSSVSDHMSEVPHKHERQQKEQAVVVAVKDSKSESLIQQLTQDLDTMRQRVTQAVSERQKLELKLLSWDTTKVQMTNVKEVLNQINVAQTEINDVYEVKIQELESRIETMVQQAKELTLQISKNRQQSVINRQQTENLISAHQNEFEKLKNTFQMAKLQQEEEATGKIIQLREEIDKLNQALIDANQRIALSSTAQNTNFNQVAPDNDIQIEREKHADAVKSLKKEYLDQVQKMQQENDHESQMMQKQLHSVQNENEQLQNQIIQLEGQIGEYKQSMEIQLEQINEKNRVDSLNKQKSLEILQSANTFQKSTIGNLQAQNQDAQQTISQLNREFNKLELKSTEQLMQKDERIDLLTADFQQKLNVQQLNHETSAKAIQEQSSSQYELLKSEYLSHQNKASQQITSLQQELKDQSEKHKEFEHTERLSNTQIAQLCQDLELSMRQNDADKIVLDQNVYIIDELRESCKKLGEQISQQTSSIQGVKVALKKKETQVRELEDVVQELENKVQLGQSLAETKEKDNKTLQSEVETKEKENKTLQEQLEINQKENQKLLSQVDAKYNEITILADFNEEIFAKLKAKEFQLQTTTESGHQLQLTLIQEKSLTSNLQIQHSQTLENLSKADTTILELKNQIDLLMSTKEDQQQQLVKQLQHQLDTQQKTLLENKLLIKQRTDEIKAIHQLYDDQKSLNIQLNQKLQEKNEMITSLQDQLLEIQQEQIQLNMRFKVLQGEYEGVVGKLRQSELNQQVLENKVQELVRQVAEQDSQEQNSVVTLENHLGLIQKLKQRLEKSLIGNKEYKDAIKEATRAKEDLQSQCNTLCAFVLEANDENKHLEALIQTLQIENNTKKNNNQPPTEDVSAAVQQKTTSSSQTDISTPLSPVAAQNNDQTAYINKMKVHFFQQEQHIEKLTSDAEVKKQQSEDSLNMLEIKLESFKIKITKLKKKNSLYQDKIVEFEQELRQQNEEIAAKDELLEEANNFISEFNDEKHELKAKFKVLMGNLNNYDGQSVSSYRSSDDIDLEQCFEMLEQELMRRDENQNSRILQITQERDNFNNDLEQKENIIAERESQLNFLKIQLSQIEESINQNDKEVQKQFELATVKISKYKQKTSELRRQNNALESQLQSLQEAPNNLPLDNKPSDSITSQNSLIVENAQLLDRLQRTELLLKKTRDNQFSQKTPPSLSAIASTLLKQDRLQDFEQQLDALRRQFVASKNEIREKILTKVEQELIHIKQAYVQDNIVSHNVLATSQVQSWNNLVELVSRVNVKGSHYLLIIGTQENTLYLVNEQDLTEQAYRYLMSFTDSDNCIMWRSQQNGEDADDESVALQQLVADLKQDLTDLRLEFLQYRTLDKLEFNPSEDSAGLIDEIEYLTGENKDLQLKVKEICLQNAELKLQLAMRLELHLDDNFDQRQDIIETARNISVLGQEQEGKEKTDFISDRDSFTDVVDGMSPLDYVNDYLVQQKLHEAHQKIEALTEQLQSQGSERGHNSEKDENDLEEVATIAHIKGTLFQFLKLTPFTEKQNEELLNIVFSMMEFSQAEIRELNLVRMGLKGNNKVVQQLALQGSGSRSNTSGVSSEGEKKIKKGLLSLFTKSKNTKADANNSKDAYQTPTPAKK